MSYQLGDAVRPNSAKINAVEWAIDVSLTACFLNLNHPGVCNMVLPMLVPLPNLLGFDPRQQPCSPASRRQVAYYSSATSGGSPRRIAPL